MNASLNTPGSGPFPRPTELMKAAGDPSGRFEPRPPAQREFLMKFGNPIGRVVAWVESRTIAKGFKSPFAIEILKDGTRKAAWFERMASDLGWTYERAKNEAYEAQSLGLIKIDAKKRLIWLCAKVEPRTIRSDRKTEGEEKANPAPSVQVLAPSYVIAAIESSPKDTRQKLRLLIANELAASEARLAKLVAMGRAYNDDLIDNIFRAHNVAPPKRGTRIKPKPSDYHQLAMFFGEPVQVAESEPVQALVQDAVSLLGFKSYGKREEASEPSVPSPLPADIVQDSAWRGVASVTEQAEPEKNGPNHAMPRTETVTPSQAGINPPSTKAEIREALARYYAYVKKRAPTQPEIAAIHQAMVETGVTLAQLLERVKARIEAGKFRPSSYMLFATIVREDCAPVAGHWNADHAPKRPPPGAAESEPNPGIELRPCPACGNLRTYFHGNTLGGCEWCLTPNGATP